MTGLYYARARYYNPQTGQWMSQDPLGFDAGDSNLSRYVNNAPTNATDPSGLQDDPTAGGLILPQPTSQDAANSLIWQDAQNKNPMPGLNLKIPDFRLFP